MTHKSYRCYFTDGNDRIQSYEQFECPDDATAVLMVEELLAASKCGTAELWQSARLVGKWSGGPGSADLKQQSPPKGAPK